MQKSSIYRVWVESAAGGSQWRGVFSEVPEKAEILDAINLDILELNPTIEHEADREREYRRLYQVVDNIDHMETDNIEVIVADVKIGAIAVTEEKIFVR